MNQHDQITMFEPEGIKLVELASDLLRNANFEARRALALKDCGFLCIAKTCACSARELLARAEVCESALQFEKLAGLS